MTIREWQQRYPRGCGPGVMPGLVYAALRQLEAGADSPMGDPEETRRTEPLLARVLSSDISELHPPTRETLEVLLSSVRPELRELGVRVSGIGR